MEELPKQQTNNHADVVSESDIEKKHVENESKTKIKKCHVLKEICNVSSKHTDGSAKIVIDNFDKVEINKKVKKEDYAKDTENLNNSGSGVVAGSRKQFIKIKEDLPKAVKRSDDDTGSETKECVKDSVIDNDITKECDSDSDHNNNDLSETDNIEITKHASEVDIDIKVTMTLTDSSLEDEEVKTIMESCDDLDQQVRKFKHTKRLLKPRKYEEIKTRRKRSKSFDNGSLQCAQNFDFTKYGISVGSRMPNDLLPGIEDYLCNVLANESLSEYAEEQRQYFLERLDIIKLPPSIPPRPQSLGVRLYPVHSTPPSSNRDSLPSVEQDDFAAYQRELSRALLGEGDSSPNISEVKVYDDIDITDGSHGAIETSKVEEEESMYEIPQIQRTLSDSGYEKAKELSPMSKSTSSEEQLWGQSGIPMPPPLPPRGERTASDAASRSSIGSILEDRMSDTPVYRSKLNRESSVPARLEKSADSRSEKSNDDLLDEEYDGVSCDSLDDIGMLIPYQDPDLKIQLPRPVKRKHKSHHRKLGKSLTSLWEITQPFGMLEDVVMSGELHYRSKLTWTRKIVALTSGRLVCYKVDKTDSRPAFVILLMGYEATLHKREGRRSFEIHLSHENFETYIFLVDFKEWAEIWCEHINAAAKGQRAPGPVVHLARSSMKANPDGTYHMAHSNVQLSNSNASLVSSDGFEAEPGTVKVKKWDQTGTKTAKMGTFAFKATQFFESLGKKSSVKKASSTGSERTPSVERIRQSSESSIGETSEKLSPMTPDSHIEESLQESPLEMKKHIKHQGYLDIYSSFNKRKWGKRWCLVHENNFECYRTQTSDVCELEFILRNCILKRAIEETKSELGLMLLENNREKITIEPVNWTELGSWLRILMQETSTPATPKGLEGYMDDTHPYHEAVEITRVPDLVQKQTVLSAQSGGNSLVNGADSKSNRGSVYNRDSGICSSESTDDRFNSLERNLNSPTVHPCFTDSSLPRVSVSETGAIYTQVKKPSVPGTNLSSATGRRNNGSQKTENFTNSVFDDTCDNDKVKTVRQSDPADDKLFFDFDIGAFNEPSFKRESSLVDEIMSELKIQQSNGMQSADDNMDNMFETDNSNTDSYFKIKRISAEFDTMETELSPIKSVDVTVIGNDSDFCCSSFVETEAKVTQYNVKKSESLRRHASNASAKEIVSVNDTLAELRTRLVQLKKDRISIRDRKQQISSETDREFLEAEYERLNWECKKVTDEIKTIEQGKEAECKIDSNQSDDLTLETVCPEVNSPVVFEDDKNKDDGFSGKGIGDNGLSSEKKECLITCDEAIGNSNNIEEKLKLKDAGINGKQVNEKLSVLQKMESVNDQTNSQSDSVQNVECNSLISQQNKNSNSTMLESQCNNESQIICDIESVPKTCNVEENTQTVNADKQKDESDKACSTSSDYVIDKLTKDFENKLFMTEK